MAKDRAQELQDLHNQGEKDGANGERHMPPNPMNPLSHIATTKTSEEMTEDRNAYFTGNVNGAKQRG